MISNIFTAQAVEVYVRIHDPHFTWWKRPHTHRFQNESSMKAVWFFFENTIPVFMGMPKKPTRPSANWCARTMCVVTLLRGTFTICDDLILQLNVKYGCRLKFCTGMMVTSNIRVWHRVHTCIQHTNCLRHPTQSRQKTANFCVLCFPLLFSRCVTYGCPLYYPIVRKTPHRCGGCT